MFSSGPRLSAEAIPGLYAGAFLGWRSTSTKLHRYDFIVNILNDMTAVNLFFCIAEP